MSQGTAVRMPMCAIATLLTAFSIVLFQCGGSGDDTDAGDATTDVTNDATPKDSGTDAGKDSGKDTGVDTGIDSGEDAGDEEDAAIDAGSPPDASADAPSDAPSSDAGCGSKMGFGYASTGDGGCGTGEQYTCGADKYEIVCECPAASCSCTKNGSSIGGTSSYSGCPKCSTSPVFSSIASSCGIPY